MLSGTASISGTLWNDVNAKAPGTRPTRASQAGPFTSTPATSQPDYLVVVATPLTQVADTDQSDKTAAVPMG